MKNSNTTTYKYYGGGKTASFIYKGEHYFRAIGQALGRCKSDKDRELILGARCNRTGHVNINALPSKAKRACIKSGMK